MKCGISQNDWFRQAWLINSAVFGKTERFHTSDDLPSSSTSIHPRNWYRRTCTFLPHRFSRLNGFQNDQLDGLGFRVRCSRILTRVLVWGIRNLGVRVSEMPMTHLQDGNHFEFLG